LIINEEKATTELHCTQENDLQFTSFNIFG
jgi:hypothetical protein